MGNYLLRDIEISREKYPQGKGVKTDLLIIKLDLVSNGDVSDIKNKDILTKIQELMCVLDPLESNKNTFTQADLVRFGNYLLSEKREDSIQNKENIREVHQEDLDNAFPVYTNTLPEAKSLNGFGAPYYLVNIQGYTNDLAMYLEDENGEKAWYKSYTSKIIRPVIGWQEVTKQQLP